MTVDGPTVKLPAVRPAALPARGVVRAIKKAVERQAIQFTGDNWADVVFFTGGGFLPVLPSEFTEPQVAVSIRARIAETGDYFDGYADPQVVAVVYDKLHDSYIGLRVGDWIVKGDRDECYPMTKTVFGERMDILGEVK